MELEAIWGCVGRGSPGVSGTSYGRVGVADNHCATSPGGYGASPVRCTTLWGRRVASPHARGGAPSPRWRSRSARRSRGSWLEGSPCAPSVASSGVRRRRLVARWRGIMAARCIAPLPPIDRRGLRADAPSYAGWPGIRLSAAPSRRSCCGRGRPSKSRAWLRQTFPSDPDMQVSPDTIYRSLFIQSRGVLKRT